MHRYEIQSFQRLLFITKYIVTDAVRAEEFPLDVIKKERNLTPRYMTVYQEKPGLDF